MSALFGSLVQGGQDADLREVARQQRFLQEKIVLCSLVLAALPMSLAFGGLPSRSEAAFFALALMPLAAALLIARGGRFAIAHSIAVGGEIAIAVLLAPVAGAGAAFAWLVLALVDLVVAADPHRLRRGLPVLVSAAVAIVVMGSGNPSARADGGAAIAGLCALLAAVVTAWRLRGDVDRSDDAGRVGRLRDAALRRAAGDAVAIFDGKGRFVEDVSGCASLIGGGRDTLRGRGFLDLVNVADRPAFLTLLAEAVKGGDAGSATLRVLASTDGQSDGPPRTLDLQLRVCAADEGVLALLRDVTAERRCADERDAAHRALAAASSAKNHFLANMSHELRTPLNAIIGFSEMLGSRTMCPIEPAKQREFAGIIHQSGRHLLETVNAILDLSRIQAGTLALLPEPFALSTLIEQCCDTLRPQAQGRRIALTCDVPAGLGELVGDRRLCREILTKLLGNAVRFTADAGRVTLRVRQDGAWLRIAIADTGIGIAEDDLARLGTPFFQAGSTQDHRQGGAGLGLSVVRGLVGLHGGSLTIESELAVGTVVTLRLPLDCRTAVADANAAIVAFPRCQRGDASRAARPAPMRPATDTRMKQSA